MSVPHKATVDGRPPGGVDQTVTVRSDDRLGGVRPWCSIGAVARLVAVVDELGVSRLPWWVPKASTRTVGWLSVFYASTCLGFSSFLLVLRYDDRVLWLLPAMWGLMACWHALAWRYLRRRAATPGVGDRG